MTSYRACARDRAPLQMCHALTNEDAWARNWSSAQVRGSLRLLLLFRGPVKLAFRKDHNIIFSNHIQTCVY